jgi:hypothetical protein
MLCNIRNIRRRLFVLCTSLKTEVWSPFCVQNGNILLSVVHRNALTGGRH